MHFRRGSICNSTLLNEGICVGWSNDKQQYYGYRLSSARMVIEDAFGIVKGRFRILKSVINVNMNDLPTVIYACFVLHNFLQVQNESSEEYLERDCEVQRRTYNRNRNETEQESGRRINERAKAIRNVFVKYFSTAHN